MAARHGGGLRPRVTAVAKGLIADGLEPGDRVAIMSRTHRRPEGRRPRRRGRLASATAAYAQQSEVLYAGRP
ncbi:hypothetical protein ACFC5X_31845 [Streptomyces sp. NPDC055952]|uniref:hypothetical protein n=1 Tax=Streptomyces sp. NPDC055952 TaxID=3345663 RepID=UPI0035E27636